MALKVSIKKGREWQLHRGHPWLFSGGISQVPGKAAPGDVVDIIDVDGQFVARGYFNPSCDIAVRILTRDADEEIDKEFVRRRILQAVELRNQCIDHATTNVYRLVNAEGDFLPGIIVDKFADVYVVQSHTAGADKLLADVVVVLEECMNPQVVVIRNDASVRKREGLDQEPPRVVRGNEPQSLPVMEHGLQFEIDVIGGQKTGFFSDQRDKRALVQRICGGLAADSVLANCFSYSGSFSVYAAKGNPAIHTINIDESEKALRLAARNFEINGMNLSNHETIAADAFAWLESQAAHQRSFQFVILDPPAFAKSGKDKDKAMKAYVRLNKLGLACCAPGAYLLTCSCSGSVSALDFELAVMTAAAESGRAVQMLESLRHGVDHPINISAPETQYLKVLLCRVV
ncbi:MAG TPA: class I SAM-dependent rRNA methyltransferase [Planktothrix sp.]|jgi:23S rRNA (cytosine1962-C5)-methyltransferase